MGCFLRRRQHARRWRPTPTLPAAAIAAALVVAGSAATTPYTVRRGDTLTWMAAHFHVSVAELTRVNHLADPNFVRAGQLLVIPTGVGTVTVSVEALRSPPPARGALPGPLRRRSDRFVLRQAFRTWAAAYGVPADLVEGLAWMESGWHSGAVSITGALGIGQLEPATVAFVSHDLIGVRLNPRVADQNIRMTARYLRWLLDQTRGNVGMALGAYYQGLTSVRAHGPLRSTKVYVWDVLGLERWFSPG